MAKPESTQGLHDNGSMRRAPPPNGAGRSRRPRRGKFAPVKVGPAGGGYSLVPRFPLARSRAFEHKDAGPTGKPLSGHSAQRRHGKHSAPHPREWTSSAVPPMKFRSRHLAVSERPARAEWKGPDSPSLGSGYFCSERVTPHSENGRDVATPEKGHARVTQCSGGSETGLRRMDVLICVCPTRTCLAAHSKSNS